MSIPVTAVSTLNVVMVCRMMIHRRHVEGPDALEFRSRLLASERARVVAWKVVMNEVGGGEWTDGFSMISWAWKDLVDKS